MKQFRCRRGYVNEGVRVLTKKRKRGGGQQSSNDLRGIALRHWVQGIQEGIRRRKCILGNGRGEV